MSNCTVYYANHRLSVVYEGFIRAAKSVNLEFNRVGVRLFKLNVTSELEIS